MTDTTNALLQEALELLANEGIDFIPVGKTSLRARMTAALATAQPETKSEGVGEVYVVHHPEDWGRYEAHDEVRIKWTGPKLGRDERVTVYATRQAQGGGEES